MNQMYKLGLSDKNTIIIGFNVDIERESVPDINDVESITIKTFNIIYKLTEWLEGERISRKPKKEVDTMLVKQKSLKHSVVLKTIMLQGVMSQQELLK